MLRPVNEEGSVRTSFCMGEKRSLGLAVIGEVSGVSIPLRYGPTALMSNGEIAHVCYQNDSESSFEK